MTNIQTRILLFVNHYSFNYRYNHALILRNYYFASTNVGCNNKSYKKNILNNDCAECPTNAISNTNRTSCVCKDGYYKISGNTSELSPCYGKPFICIFQTVYLKLQKVIHYFFTKSHNAVHALFEVPNSAKLKLCRF